MGKRSSGFGPPGWIGRPVCPSVDFCYGMDRLLVQVREVLGRKPLDGSAYVFHNWRATWLKALLDSQGV